MSDLYLVQLPLKTREFTQWALDHRFLQVPPGDRSGAPRIADNGYAVHAALAALFGKQGPRPFFCSTLGRQNSLKSESGSSHSAREMNLLGYCRVPRCYAEIPRTIGP